MNRTQFDHAIRAAATHAGIDDVVVFGSQAILAWFPDADLPNEATMSFEVDICPFDDDDHRRADNIDGGMGEDSAFHQQFGYYAQGTNMDFVCAPQGWWPRRKEVTVARPDGSLVTAHCMEPHDACISKIVAGRSKDVEYCRALIASGHVDVDLLERRLAEVPDLDAAQVKRAEGTLRRLRQESGS